MNTRKFSNKQEKQVSKSIGGRRQANSGATAFRKGDVITDTFCIECKTTTTEKKSVTIQREWIDKLIEEAFAMRKPNWAVAFNFGGLDSTENFYIINEDLFRQLITLKESEENN